MLNTCLKPLLEVCDLLDSKRIPITSNKRIHGPYPYYGANGIQDYVNDYIFDDELVLLAEDGGNFGSKDKPIAYRVSGKCWVNNHAHVLKPREGLNVDYLCYSLMYYDTKGLVNGATRQKLTQAAMKNIKIPILEYNEQLKIVKRIASVSALIYKKEKVISLLNELVKSRFIEMFSVEKGWPIVKLESLCDSIVRGPFGSALKVSFFVEKGPDAVKVYEQKNAIQRSAKLGESYVTQDKYQELKRFSCGPGDFIMSCSGTIGCLYQIPEGAEPGIINQALCKFHLNGRMLPEVFLTYMRNSVDQLETKGSGIKNIGAVSYIKNMEIALPPIEVQQQFAEFINQSDKSKYCGRISLHLL